MMEKSKFLNKGRIIQIASIILIVFLCCVNINKLDYIAVLNDEFGYWGSAASIVGYDWKELIAETPYYAWGYSVWLIPIMGLLPTPELWYKAAIFLNIILLVASYFLCSRVGRKIFPEVDKNIIFAVSLIVIIYPANIIYAQVAWSETLLYFLMWAATYLLLNIEERFTWTKFVGFVLLLIYMYMVHARTIGCVGIGLVCLFLVLVKNKKPILSYLIVLVLAGIGYIINDGIKAYQISELWSNSQSSTMNNVGLNQETILLYVQKFVKDIRLFLESLGGKLIYTIVGSGLTVLVLLVRFAKEEINRVKNRELFSNYHITKIWCVFAFLASWILCSLQMLSWEERKDIILYSRYMENAMGPLLLLGIIYTLTMIKDVRIGVCLSAITLILGLRSVYWRVLEGTGFFNSICSPIFGAFYDFFNEDTRKTFYCIASICILFFIVIYVSTFIKKSNLRNSIIIMCFAVYFIFTGNKASIYTNDARDYFDSSTVPIKNLIVNEYNTEKLYYVRNENDPYSTNPKYLQYMIPNQSIHIVDNNDIERINENCIIFTNPSDQLGEKIINETENVKLILSTNLLNVYYFN